MPAVSPIKLAEISLVEANYVRETIVQIWEDMVMLLCGSLLVALSALPTVVLIWLTGYGPWLAVGLFPVAPAWVACCYMSGRTTIYGEAHLGDFVAALVHCFWRSCVLVLPVVLLLVMVSVGLSLEAGGPALLFTVGVVFQLVALCVAASVFLFAAPILGLFQVACLQAWSYGLALLLRNPLVALGLMSMATLLVTAANALGLGLWLIIPLIFIPFEVNATLMLVKKATELERSRSVSK